MIWGLEFRPVLFRSAGEEEEEEEEEEPAPKARKKPAAKAPTKKSSDKYELPSVSMLAAPKSSDRQPLSKSELEANSRALEGVLQDFGVRGEEHTSELQSPDHLVCRLLLEKKKKKPQNFLNLKKKKKRNTNKTK